MSEVDAGRDRATPASVRHDDDHPVFPCYWFSPMTRATRHARRGWRRRKSLASTWNRCLPGRWRTVSLQQAGENPTLTVCSGLVHAPTPCRTLPPRPPIGSQPFKTLAVVLIYFRSGPGWRPGVNSHLPPDISLRSIFVSLPAKTGAEGSRQQN